MMDSFDEKRGIVKKLLDMLKSHASNEVSSGLQKPKGMPEDAHGIQVEKVMVADHDMDHPTPEHEVETKELAKGGLVMDKPASEGEYVDAPHKTIPYESAEGHPDTEGSVQEEAHEPLQEREAEATEEPLHPAFETFFSKKRKK